MGQPCGIPGDPEKEEIQLLFSRSSWSVRNPTQQINNDNSVGHVVYEVCTVCRGGTDQGKGKDAEAEFSRRNRS